MFWSARSPIALCLALLLAGPAGAEQRPAKPPAPAAPLFHGNWCGAGDAGRTSPVDAFDAACRAHDLCYEKFGRNDCRCDKAFLRATAALVKNPRTEETIRSKAATANSLFSAVPCADPAKSREARKKR